MLKFREFIVEYLTDEQRERYKDVSMTAKARRDTDHFFGKGNDEVKGTIPSDEKSEIHTQLETHLGKPLTHDEYRTGIVKDKYGRDVKLGRMIKDENLRNQFDKDVVRKTGYNSTIGTRTVRGIEVAGQTNSAPNPEHPKGHSWGDASCKNVDTGIKIHFLEPEIKHGTVVHFVHDHNGQEIYRATLQPHYNKQGKVAYAVDAEYGLKHPKFTEDAHRVASELSGKSRGDIIHTKHENVYDDSGVNAIMHPNVSEKQLSKHIKSPDWSVRAMAASHANLNHDHLMALMKDEDLDVVSTALTHPRIDSSHVTQALKHNDVDVVAKAVAHPKAALDHIRQAAKHKSYIIRKAVASNINTPDDVLNKLGHDNSHEVRAEVVSHPKVSASYIAKAVNDPSWVVRRNVAKHQNLTHAQISQLVNDDDSQVVFTVARHPKLTADHITTIMKSGNVDAREMAVQHMNFNHSHLTDAIKNDNSYTAIVAANKFYDKLTPEHLGMLANHNRWRARKIAAEHPNTNRKTLNKLRKDNDFNVATTANDRLKKRD